MQEPLNIAVAHSEEVLADIVQLVDIAKQVIPPLWPLESPIAINPLAGFEDLPFGTAVAQASHIFNAPVHGALRHWRKLLAAGKVDTTLLSQIAVERLGGPDLAFAEALPGVNAHALLMARLLEIDDFPKDETVRSLDPAERFIAKWCAAFFDRGMAAHPMPWREKGLYRAVLALCLHDTAFHDLAGADAAAIHAAMPANPYAAIQDTFFELGIEPERQLDWLRSMLARLPGWAGHIRWRSERADHETSLDAPATIADLLALWSLVARCRKGQGQSCGAAHDPRPAIQRYFNLPDRTIEHLPATRRARAAFVMNLGPVDLVLMFMEAAERSYAADLAGRLRKSVRTMVQDEARRDAQFVFCIDVRSEPFRRAIEATGDYETLGYAGFFGLPIALRSPLDSQRRRQLPVLLEPQYELGHAEPGAAQAQGAGLVGRVREGLALRQLASSAKQGIATSFTMAEATGPLAAAMLAVRSFAPQLAEKLSLPHPDTLHAKARPCLGSEGDGAIPLDKKLEFAVNLFQMTGLRAERLAPLVVLAGHGASTVNNAFAGTLDCGACGGRAGGPNARVLAHILNEPAVRERLKDRGHAIPDDTYFLAAQHDTTTDVLEWYEDDHLPVAHRERFDRLKADLLQAGRTNREERASRLGRSPADLLKGAFHWGEVRPEWGLAGNAAFLVADRAASRDIDLEGRAFLHSYDWRQDEDGSALHAIMTAPMVVAQWINSQYLFSTVNNARFGAGDKSTHNVIGGFGVMQGNGGDLCVGLPRQSLFNDDGAPFHIPQRLLVLVHAPLERVDRIVTETPLLTRLFGNGWLRLVVIDPNDNSAHRWIQGETIMLSDAAVGGWSPNHYAL